MQIFDMRRGEIVEQHKRCVYCNSPITEISMEHVIQQALGGRYESPDILCQKCNEFVGASIDVPFNRIFNPIVGQIENFIKQRKSSQPKYKGKARYEGVVYDVIIQNKRVVACAELSRKLKNNVKISQLDFEMDDGKLVEVQYNYPIIPFVPLNPMDQYMEMEAEFSLYHNLILFSQEQHLWCYVELFGTFQYYVLLSNQWDKSNIVLESYLQLIQKIDRTPPQMKRWRPKYGLIYSDVYDVPSSPDREVMRERVAEAVRLEPYEKTMSKLVSPKMDSKYLLNYVRTDLSENEKRKYALSLLLYFNEEDHLIENRYRQVTLGEQEWEMVSYPLKLMLLRNQGKLNENEYQEKKLSRLNIMAQLSRV